MVRCADGRYTFATLAAGSYALVFDPEPGSGIPFQWRGGSTRAASPVVTIDEAGEPVGVDVELAASGSISGKHSRPDGQPAAGVPVRAYPIGMSVYFPSAVTTTAADGSYTLTGLVPGDYEVLFVSLRRRRNHGGTECHTSLGCREEPGGEGVDPAAPRRTERRRWAP